MRSVAAGAALAGARGRHGRRAQPEVVERAVQLAADLVEHLLAGDQIVCGQQRGHSRRLGSSAVSRHTHTHARGPAGAHRGTEIPSAIVSDVYCQHKK